MEQTDLEKLVLRIEANTTQFNKALKKVEHNTASSFRKSEKSVDRFSGKLKGLGSVAHDTVGAFAGFGGMGGLIGGGVVGTITALGAGVKAAAGDVARLAAEAKRAGVSFEAFQELQYSTAKSGVGIDALTDGLKEMQLRADEFILTGKGSASEAFERLGYTAGDLAVKLKEPDKLFEEIIGRLQQLDKAAQIRVADEIFGGTGGEQFVQLLDKGVTALRDGRKEARALGAVLKNEVAGEAAAINREFDKIATSLGTKLKWAVVKMATGAIQLRNRFDDSVVGDSNAGVADTVFRLGDEYRLAKERFEQAQKDLIGVRAQGAHAQGLSQARAKADELYQEVARLEKSIAQADYDLGGGAISVAGLDLKAIQKRMGLVASAVEPFTPITPKKPGNKPGSKPKKNSADDPVKQADKVRQVILELEHEAAQLGRVSDEQELYNALKKAGVSLHSEQGQAVAQAVAGLQAERVVIQAIANDQSMLALQVDELTHSFDYLGQTGLNTLLAIVGGSESAGDAIKRMGLQMANAAAQAALFGSGPMAGMMQALTGASGGFLTSIFSSISRSVIGSGASLSPGHLFGSGGYTGPGPKNAPAGVVHKGEVVWSQLDVARAGGVAAVEAMRLGRRGFSGGGIVGANLFDPVIGGRVEPHRPFGSANAQVIGSGDTHHWHISTPDVAGFKRSQSQIAATISHMAARGRRNS